jgi:argininosuccinate lyase
MLLATDVADYLVRRGLPFRRAHEVVGGLVRKLVAEEREFDSLSMKEWRAVHDLFGDDIASHVTPAASVAAKRTPQSTAPAAVQLALADTRAWLAGLK